MPSLADHLAAAHTNRGSRCTMAKLLESLTDPDRDALVKAMGSEMPGQAIARALRAAGHEISGTTVQRHRRGDCRCEKP